MSAWICSALDKAPCPGSGELQAEAGGDKLVAVVSHPHAVAEVVEDVMCVERRPEGSSTRWLTAAERDDLARGTSQAACSPSSS